MEPTTIYLYSPRADVYSENGHLCFELLFDCSHIPSTDGFV